MTVFDLIDERVARIGAVAPAGHFLALRIRGNAPLMSFSTYPKPWQFAYMANGYLLRDPITTWAMTIGGAIRWSSPFLPDPFGVFRHAAKFGLRYGASVAHGPVRSLTVCSFARGDREATDEEIALVRETVIALHDLTELPRSLSAEDRTILEQGEDPGTAARALGLGEGETRQRLADLCERLFAHSPDEALRRARDHKLV